MRTLRQLRHNALSAEATQEDNAAIKRTFYQSKFHLGTRIFFNVEDGLNKSVIELPHKCSKIYSTAQMIIVLINPAVN